VGWIRRKSFRLQKGGEESCTYCVNLKEAKGGDVTGRDGSDTHPREI